MNTELRMVAQKALSEALKKPYKDAGELMDAMAEEVRAGKDEAAVTES